MNNKPPAEQASSLNVGDIYYVLFRQKWIILSFFAMGLLAAGALFIIKPARYESDATLYIQYVTGVRIPSQNNGETVQTTDPNGGNILNTEIEFLTSQDLAREVVSNLGPERILAKYGVAPNTNTAVYVVMKNLITDETPKNPTMIHIGYQHPDPDVAKEVLWEIILAYRGKSADMRRTGEFSPESLTLMIDQMRGKIAGTERELRAANQDAGIISTLGDTRKGLNDEFQKIKAEILDQESKLSEFGAVLPDGANTNAATAEVTTNSTQEIPSDKIDQYNTLLNAISGVRVKQVEAMLRYREGSDFLNGIAEQLASLTRQKRALEDQFPGLQNVGAGVATRVPGQNVDAAMVESGPGAVKKLKARVDYLKARLAENKADQARLDVLQPNIFELESRKQLQLAQFNMLQTGLERAMSSDNQSNSGGIKIDESPTPAVKKHSKTFKKLLMMVLAGGVFGGLGVAFLIEKVLDRSIRRPGEIEAKLHLPLFITIPDMNGNARTALPADNYRLLKDANDGALVPVTGGSTGDTDIFGVAPWDHRNSLHRFYAGLRDRLIVNFEVRNLNHNPKLVAVTSCGRGAGVSSIAAGLAASMSETGDGNVLLVNMRGEEGAAQQFCHGMPACGLDDALASETKENAFVHENLYVANEGGGGDLPRILPKRFASLLPKLKASDFDYIIFDMPPVSQTSVTPRLAGLMDMVLLVIESEKTNRDAVQRATALLAESKANVSTVLNKVKTYVPARLHQEFLDDDAGD